MSYVRGAEELRSELTMGRTNLDLKAEQAKTLARPVMEANFVLRILYRTMDALYGKERSLTKFRVIELLARYPYIAWEDGAYRNITHRYTKPGVVRDEDLRNDLELIDMSRSSQDNEQWHLVIIQDIMNQKGMKVGVIRGVVLPYLMAFSYYHLTRLMYLFKPAWAFSMNARFESHAEHEYMHLVAEHPEWENEPVETEYFKYYPRQKSLADLFRRIGLDERDHMNVSRCEYFRITGEGLDRDSAIQTAAA